VTNAEIAAVLEKIARLLEVQGAIRFKVQTYDRLSRIVADHDRPLADLHAAGGRKALLAIPGIGEGTAGKIEEMLTAGTCTRYEDLKASLPKGIEELLAVPGMGPKTALIVAKTLNVHSLDDLERALVAHRLAPLPRMGEKLEEKLRHGIAIVRQGQARRPLGEALGITEALLAALRALPGVARAEVAGSLRRMRDTVGDLDFLVSPRHRGDGPAVMKAFVESPNVREVVARGETKASVRLRTGLDADLRVVEGAAFGAALHYFTGSKAHNIAIRELGVRAKLKINEYGVFRGTRRIGGREEAEVFRAVGLPVIPPEIRENEGEIEAAAKGQLPRLLDARDIRGDLHVHSNWSDGRATMEAMVAAARALGYEYLAFCDHSQSLKIAGGVSVADLRKKNREIDALNRSLRGFRILKGSEVDILADGSLDYPDDVLAGLDVVVASVHTRFNLDAAAQTKRVTAALRHRQVTLLGHPTGRLLGQRDPHPIDLAEIIKVAKEEGKALELNAQPDRLDLSEHPLREARAAGVMIAVNSDAHDPASLARVPGIGAGAARRGWLEPQHVLNALPLAELLEFTAHASPRA